MAFRCPSLDIANDSIRGSSAAALQNGQLLRATSQQKDEQQNWNRNSQQPKQQPLTHSNTPNTRSKKRRNREALDTDAVRRFRGQSRIARTPVF